MIPDPSTPFKLGIGVNHSKFGIQLLKLYSCKSSCKDISHLLMSWYTIQNQDPFFNFFLDKVSIKFHVLGPVVMNKVLNNVHSCLVVSEHQYWFFYKNFEFLSNLFLRILLLHYFLQQLMVSYFVAWQNCPIRMYSNQLWIFYQWTNLSSLHLQKLPPFDLSLSKENSLPHGHL